MNIRQIIDLIEAANNTRDLFRQVMASPIVASPWEKDEQLQYVLQDHEFDYDWHFLILPMQIAGNGLDLSLDPNPGCNDEDEDERFQQIRGWAKENGGIAKALAICPPAFLLGAKGLTCIDGRHRLALAKNEGLTEVPAIIALESNGD